MQPYCYHDDNMPLLLLLRSSSEYWLMRYMKPQDTVISVREREREGNKILSIVCYSQLPGSITDLMAATDDALEM